MNIKSPFGIAAVVVIGVPVLWLALGASGLLVIKNPIPQRADVVLTIENNQLVIKAATGRAANCPAGEAKGCIRVSKWRKAHIRFLLDDMDGWEFRKIQLVAEPESKLDFGDQAGFTQDMIDDFYVKINNVKQYPDTDGTIELAGLKKGDEFKLIDRNKFKQIYSYQIRACNTAVNPQVCKNSDPKIINEG
jgi:hypothetical protein